MTPSALPAGKAVMSFGSDRLTAAAGVGSDQRGCSHEFVVAKSKPERAGRESLKPDPSVFTASSRARVAGPEAAAMSRGGSRNFVRGGPVH